MTTQENIYHFARVSGTITAGIFTGLALSAPIQAATLLTSSLVPHASRVDQFEKLHKATAGAAFPVAGVAGALFALAAWVRPGEVVLSTGAGKGGIGMTVVSDKLRQVTPLTLLLPPLLLLSVPLLSWPMTRAVKQAAASSSLATAEKIAPSTTATGASGSTFAGDQFESDVKAWGTWLTIGAVVGGAAAFIGGAGLVGWGI